MNISMDGCRYATDRTLSGGSMTRSGHSRNLANRSAVEKPELWKPAKTKSRFPPLPTPPWKSRPNREIPTFPPHRLLFVRVNESQRLLTPPKPKTPKADRSRVNKSGHLDKVATVLQIG